MKRKSINTFNSNFVTELKTTDPGIWYSMAKHIGAVEQLHNGDIMVESLSNLDNCQAAQNIAQHFSSISNEYVPIDNSLLHNHHIKLKNMKYTCGSNV